LYKNSSEEYILNSYAQIHRITSIVLRITRPHDIEIPHARVAVGVCFHFKQTEGEPFICVIYWHKNPFFATCSHNEEKHCKNL